MKIILQKLEHAIIFQILEQTENLRVVDGQKEFVSENGIKIISSSFPPFDYPHFRLLIGGNFEICVRGSNIKEDFAVDAINFMSNIQRDEQYGRIKTALADFSKRGFLK